MPTWVPVVVGVVVIIATNIITIFISFLRLQTIYSERQLAIERELNRLAQEITELDKDKVPYPVFNSTQESMRELIKMIQDTVLQRLDRLEHHIDGRLHRDEE